MQTIQIITSGGKVRILLNGTEIERIHSFTVEYVQGAPVLYSCVAELGEEKREDKRLLN